MIGDHAGEADEEESVRVIVGIEAQRGPRVQGWLPATRYTRSTRYNWAATGKATRSEG